MLANKFNKPILLIHGEEDSKVTTAMQVASSNIIFWGISVLNALFVLQF